MARTEPCLPLLLAVDQAHHRRICRDEDAALTAPVGYEIHRSRIGQMHLEGAGCLVNQGDAIGKKQDALDPACAHQEIDKRDHGARLSGPRRHHEQRLAFAVLVEMPRDGADCTLLIGPFDNPAIDGL